MLRSSKVSERLRTVAARVGYTQRAGNALRFPPLVLLLLLLYLGLAPVWAPDITEFRYDRARCFQLILLATIVLTFLSSRTRNHLGEAWRALGIWARGAMLAVIALGSASALISDSPRLGSLELALNVQLLCVFLSVVAAVSKEREISQRILSAGISLGAGVLVLQFWTTVGLNTLEGRRFSWVSPFLEFANVRFFNQYQAYALLMLTVPLSLLRLPLVWRALVLLIGANLWALQWALGGRAVWVGFAAAMLLVGMLTRTKGLSWIVAQLSLCVAGGLLFLLLGAVQSDAERGGDALPEKLSVVDRGWQSVGERGAMAQSALEIIRNRPLLGIGPGQFGLHHATTMAAHPHNSLLQLLSEYGLIAGSAAILLGIFLLTLALKRLRPTDGKIDSVDMALAAALIFGLVESLFSGNLIMPHSQVLLCVIAGWIVGRQVDETPLVLPGRWAKVETTAIVGLSIAAVAVTTLFAYSYIQVVNNMPAWLADRPPHFWQYGRWGTW